MVCREYNISHCIATKGIDHLLYVVLPPDMVLAHSKTWLLDIEGNIMYPSCLILQKLKQFNRQLKVNKDLREEIDHLRQEKSRFDNIYKQLSKKLELIKREMTDVIEQATLAFEQR